MCEKVHTLTHTTKTKLRHDLSAKGVTAYLSFVLFFSDTTILKQIIFLLQQGCPSAAFTDFSSPTPLCCSVSNLNKTSSKFVICQFPS